MNLNDKYVFEYKDSVKIATVGDLHLSANTPSSRVDNYEEACIDKLNNLYSLCITQGIKYVILVGDIFHSYRNTVPFVSKIIEAFDSFRFHGIKVFSIAGNHDLLYSTLDTIKETSIYNLFLSGVVLPFSSIRFIKEGEGFKFGITGFHYSELIEKPEVSDEYNICVAHQFFYDEGFSEDTITKEMLNTLPYDCYILGHSHIPFITKDYSSVRGTSKVIRTGSFTRHDAQAYQLRDTINCDIITLSNSLSVDRIPMQIKPFSEVFSSQVVDKSTLKQSIKSLKENFSNLISEINNSSTNDKDIYGYMNQMNLDPKIKSLVTQYLENEYIYPQN